MKSEDQLLDFPIQSETMKDDYMKSSVVLVLADDLQRYANQYREVAERNGRCNDSLEVVTKDTVAERRLKNELKVSQGLMEALQKKFDDTTADLDDKLKAARAATALAKKEVKELTTQLSAANAKLSSVDESKVGGDNDDDDDDTEDLDDSSASGKKKFVEELDKLNKQLALKDDLLQKTQAMLVHVQSELANKEKFLNMEDVGKGNVTSIKGYTPDHHTDSFSFLLE